MVGWWWHGDVVVCPVVVASERSCGQDDGGRPTGGGPSRGRVARHAAGVLAAAERVTDWLRRSGGGRVVVGGATNRRRLRPAVDCDRLRGVMVLMRMHGGWRRRGDRCGAMHALRVECYVYCGNAGVLVQFLCNRLYTN